MEKTQQRHLLANKLETDLLVQAILLPLWVVLGIYDAPSFMLTCYCVVGGYQLLSALLHLALFKTTPLYRWYYHQLLFRAVMFALATLSNAGIGILLAELFLSALSALYYFIITIIAFNHAKK